MNIAKGVLALVGSVAMSSIGFAQQAAISGEKTAPLQNILPNSYGLLEVRHTTKEVVNPTTGDSNVTPVVAFRPTLGSTFFDGKLDTAFTWIFEKRTEDARIRKPAMFNETTLTVYENENFKFMPYFYAEKGPSENSAGFDFAQIGPHVDLMKTFAIQTGSITLSGYVEPLAEFYSKPGLPKSDLRNQTNKGNKELGLALNNAEPEADKGVEITRKDPSFLNTTEVAVKFVPASMSALSVGVAADYLQGWAPKYRAVEKDGATLVENDGYKTEAMVINKFTVSYKVNDTITIINQARYGIDGFYAATQEKGDNATLSSNRFENRLAIKATLF